VKDYLTDLLEFTASINDDKLCIVTKTAALVCSKSINISFGRLLSVESRHAARHSGDCDELSPPKLNAKKMERRTE
jgi:hypothetical protein